MSADAISHQVLRVFETLPAKAKPRIHKDGIREWTTLSGIVLSKKNCDPVCVTLGTGLRCLPASKLAQAKGRCLHDWHAEIVAIRGFNRFLLDQCTSLVKDAVNQSEWVRARAQDEMTTADPQPFAIHDDVRIDMYSSEAPCGDASMELVMQAQADPTPWDEPPGIEVLDGRGYFSKLGAVRRKPARADAPPTSSKSCSDKLAMKQITSLLNGVTSLLVHPSRAYLASLSLPTSQVVVVALERCFGASGRLSSLIMPDGRIPAWSGGYSFRPFDVLSTSREFAFKKGLPDKQSKSTGSNITAAWINGELEVLIGGTRSGFKQFSVRGASMISRVALWEASLAIARSLANADLALYLQQEAYVDVKKGRLLAPREQMKADVRAKALKRWGVGEDDDAFSVTGGH